MGQLSEDTIAIIKAIEKMRVEIENQLYDLKDKCKTLEAGFPLEDPNGHRKYHEAIIERQQLRNDIFRESLTHAAKVGFLSGIVFFCWLVWLYLKTEISRP